MSRLLSSASVLGALLFGACNNAPSSPPAAKSAPAKAAAGSTALTEGKAAITPEVRELFKTRCAVCHGESGKGDGPGAGALNPKPRDYTNKEWQAKVTDDDLRKVIHYGGAAVGKSPMMPASPDLEARPSDVNGLIAIIREFGNR